MALTIRSVRDGDIPRLLEIYAPYVEETYITFEYQPPTLEEFTRRINAVREKFPCLLAEENGEVLGYAYAAPFKVRPAYDWSVETSIYNRKDCRRRGQGRALYQRLEELLRAQNVMNMNACISYPHPESIAFHTAMGFRMVGRFTRCGYKLGAWRDMVWMEKLIGDHPVPPPPLLPPVRIP